MKDSSEALAPTSRKHEGRSRRRSRGFPPLLDRPGQPPARLLLPPTMATALRTALVTAKAGAGAVAKAKKINPDLLHNRIQALDRLRASIFQTSYNPTGVRTGAKYLRNRLRGPSMVEYYPPEVDLAKIAREYPELEIINEAEQQRLQDVLDRKTRGKGTPKKAKNKGMSAVRASLDWYLYAIARGDQESVAQALNSSRTSHSCSILYRCRDASRAHIHALGSSHTSSILAWASASPVVNTRTGVRTSATSSQSRRSATQWGTCKCPFLMALLLGMMSTEESTESTLLGMSFRHSTAVLELHCVNSFHPGTAQPLPRCPFEQNNGSKASNRSVRLIRSPLPTFSYRRVRVRWRVQAF